MGKHLGFGLSVVAPLLLGAWGCSGEVSAGPGINLARCLGVSCSSAPQAIQGGEGDSSQPCVDNGLALAEPFRFDGAGQEFQVLQLRPSPDGSFWALASKSSLDVNESGVNVLLHYSSEGTLLQVGSALEAHGGYPSMKDPSFVVDAGGNVSVAIYGVYAETADSEVFESLRLMTFDPSFELVGDQVFSGIASAHLAPAPSGSLMLAGNATGNAANGVLTRLVDWAPTWIQTKVPTSGEGVGTGVAGLVVDASGRATILSQRNGRWTEGPDVSTFGLTQFDASGEPSWDLTLPTAFAGGYPMELATTSNGAFAVAGLLDHETMQIRGVSRDAELRWAFNTRGFWPNVVIDSSTDKTFAFGFDSLVVIDAAGTLCQQLEIPLAQEEAPVVSTGLFVQEPYVYIGMNDHVRRYRLPSE